LSNSKTHIVLFSGGLASYEVGRRVINKFGKGNVKLWFFDTLIEDNSLYEFLDQCEKLFDIKIDRLQDGRNPWQVFRDERFIGNSRITLCSRVLKRELLVRLLRINYPDKNVILYLGYEAFETKRIDKARERWNDKGYSVEFPLEKPPFFRKDELIKSLVSKGINIPCLYQLGFTHNNCGGACVQAGINQWIKLLHIFPERYLWHEEQEQQTRKFLNKDVSILRDRTDNHTRPLTLQELRHRIEHLKQKK
jgi:3'-phosphoadenosine 5'-phosphosulfate sulfotransferase (PAPS reductase)/FAD synthetase